jgi:hypothetical protein
MILRHAFLVVTLALLGLTLYGQRLALAASFEAPTGAQPAQAVQGAYYWNYSAKFVCGLQAPVAQQQGEPPVKWGNYATVINIHNYNYREADVRKKVLVLYENNQPVGREPNAVGPRGTDKITLAPDYATMDDCNRLWELTHPGTTTIPFPMPIFEGYLVILSRIDLDVDAVYTAADYPNPTPSPSIDVERIPGKRVFIPTGALP